MAEVPSTFQLTAGMAAPHFDLPDGKGERHELSDLIAGKAGIVIAFVCNHCPFVIHLAKDLGEFAEECDDLDIPFVAINANDVGNYPADAPEKMVEFADENDWDFPYLYDESQAVAKAYAAACTPDFYLFDASLKLVYAGQFDDSRPKRDEPVTGSDLRRAITALRAGESVPEPWYPSTGCNIKWKAGNEPDYFG